MDLAATAEKMLKAASGEKIWFFKGKLNVIYQELLGSGEEWKHSWHGTFMASAARLLRGRDASLVSSYMPKNSSCDSECKRSYSTFHSGKLKIPHGKRWL